MRYLLTGCFFSVAVLATMHTQAGARLDQLAEPVVSVISTDGEHYNSLKGPGQPLEFMMSGQCTDNRKLTQAYVISREWAPITGNEGNFYVDLSNKPTAQSSELPPTEVGVPDGIYLNGVEYPIEWRSKIIDACNINLEQKQQYFGLGKSEVLGKSWDLKGVKLGSLSTPHRASISGHSMEWGGGYYASGTSFATAFVTAAVALSAPTQAQVGDPEYGHGVLTLKEGCSS